MFIILKHAFTNPGWESTFQPKTMLRNLTNLFPELADPKKTFVLKVILKKVWSYQALNQGPLDHTLLTIISPQMTSIRIILIIKFEG